MRTRNIPNVNASLLHEARMIFQQFFGARPDNYYSMRIAEAQAKAQQNSAVLKCCFCVDKSSDAKTIIGGFAVCTQHEHGMRLHYKDYQAYLYKMSS